MNELEQIHKRVRMGVLEALEESESGALAHSALLKRIKDVAADADDVELALQELKRSGLIERVPGGGPARWRQTQPSRAGERAIKPDDDAPEQPADEQPIAEPSYHAADRPANDAPATTGHRFGLWSDGTLAIETGAGELNLPPAVTYDLIAYLIRERTQVAHLFDTELEV